MILINIGSYFAVMIGIYAILAIGLNFQYGFSGLINFGHVGFFAIGAYSSVLLAQIGLPIPLSLLAGVVAGGFFGYLVALPTQKLSVHYWAITTIGIADIIRLVALNEEWLTEGSFGITDIRQPLADIIPVEVYTIFYAALVLGAVLVCYFIMRYISDSPFGRILKAIREDEDLPLALGKNAFTVKVKVMIIGASLAGLAGGLYAHFVTYISPLDFLPIVTFIVWAMIIVGGKGNLVGSIVGAAIIMVFFDSTRFLKDLVGIDPQAIASLRMIIIGLLIMLFVVYRPDGIINEKKKEIEVNNGPQ